MMKNRTSFNTFYKTFSGADTLVFIVIPNTKPIVLGTITTLSYSTYRIKKPVPTLGRINVSGYTRGMRTIAGSMVFTMVNQHWVHELGDAIKCLGVYGNLKPDELPLFDLILVSANEYGASATEYIYGVDVTDDAGVISVNDLYTETTISFLARDIDLAKEYSSTVTSRELQNKDITVNEYSVSINNMKIPDASILNKSRLKLEEIEDDKKEEYLINHLSVDKNIDSIDVNEVLHEFEKSNVNIFTKSYYQNSYTKTYLNKTPQNIVYYSDIISSLVYDIDTNSYPKYVDCILKRHKEIVKIRINIKVGD